MPQVTEEDIARCMGLPPRPLLLAPPDLDENGHPLRALSEENLTYASSFSGRGRSGGALVPSCCRVTV